MKHGLWELPNGDSAYFEINNSGKKSITIDLKKDKGREVIYRLVEKSDVLVHNFRQGVPERVKMDYDTLRQHNPRLIYATASGYGPRGPEKSEPSYDFIGLARSGIMNITGDPENRPEPVQGGIGDQVGAIMTSYGVLAALLVRERTGMGQKVDASHLGSLMMLQGLAVGRQLFLKKDWYSESRKKANNPLWNYYKCRDGRWVMLSMLQPDRQWPDVCRALGMEHMIDDPRSRDIPARQQHSEEIIAIMDSIFITKTAAEWMKILKDTGDIICCPIQSISDLQNDPQVLANGYIVDYNHESLGPVKAMKMPLEFSETPPVVRAEAPHFGQHTEEVLIEVGGYSWEEITRLRDEEVI
jgi:crotonobetainyl-CoA:carnitine CoA-transferase CaiB-like acyl-CoA transferase